MKITLGRFTASLALRQRTRTSSRVTATTCLFITGFIQSGFAANIIFGGRCAGAGDTLGVMWINLTTVIFLRFGGVIVIGAYGCIWDWRSGVFLLANCLRRGAGVSAVFC